MISRILVSVPELVGPKYGTRKSIFFTSKPFPHLGSTLRIGSIRPDNISIIAAPMARKKPVFLPCVLSRPPMSVHLVLDNTLGAAFIGVVAAATLHGVSCVQAWYYYTHQTDSWPIKSLVGAVMIFDTIHQILITHTAYIYLVSNWGNVEILPRIVWSLIVEVLFNGLTAFLVQSFLAARVWRLSNRNIWLNMAIGLLVVGEFGSVLAFTALALPFTTFAELTTLKDLSVVVNALAAAGDVLIAGTLCLILHFSRTGFHRSDTMINKLIIFAVNTGFLTSLCAIASLISITVAGNTFLYIAFFFCLGRLYTNSLLATLNARKMFRGATGMQTTSENNLSLSLRDFPKNATRQPNISIKIDTTQQFAADTEHQHEEKSSITMMSSIGKETEATAM